MNCEIECRITMTKAAFNKMRALLNSTMNLEMRKKLVKCYIWSLVLYGDEIWTLRAVQFNSIYFVFVRSKGVVAQRI